MRIIDYLRIKQPYDDASRELMDRSNLDAPVVAVDDFVFANVGKEINLRELPPVRPCFDEMWVEWHFREKQGGVAVFISYSHAQLQMVLAGFALLVAMEPYAAQFGAYVDLDERGELQGFELRVHPLPTQPPVPDDQTEQIMANLAGTVLQCLAVINCKNVTLREVTPEQRPTHLRRAKKKGRAGRKPALVRYHVLDIKPMGVAHGAHGSNGTERLTALHIQRGHFKDYREHGLFGKAHGVYWWSAHMRGDRSAGLVLKDYAVKV